MGDEIGDTPAVERETRAPDAASPHVEPDPGDAGALPEEPKLHMTGRGLSPAEYQAQHGSHDHQADFSHGRPGRRPKHEGVDNEEEQTEQAKPR